jgi:Ras-related protein Rab-8A
MKEHQIRKKCLIIGPTNSGKTTLLNTYKNQKYKEDRKSYLYGAEYSNIKINHNISLDAWDITNCQQYHQVTDFYYKNADVVILVFDVSDKQSIHTLKKWVTKIKTHTNNIIIVGNKVDLLKHGNPDYVKERYRAVLMSAKNVDSVNGLFQTTLLKHCCK